MRVGGKIGSATAKLDAFFMHKCTLNCALFDVTFVWIFALDSRIFFPAFREYKLFLTLLGSKFLFFPVFPAFSHFLVLAHFSLLFHILLSLSLGSKYVFSRVRYLSGS